MLGITGPAWLRRTLDNTVVENAVIKIFTICGAVAASLFGAWTIIMINAHAPVEEVHFGGAQVVAIIQLGMLGALGGLLVGAVVRLLFRHRKPPQKETE